MGYNFEMNREDRFYLMFSEQQIDGVTNQVFMLQVRNKNVLNILL